MDSQFVQGMDGRGEDVSVSSVSLSRGRCGTFCFTCCARDWL